MKPPPPVTTILMIQFSLLGTWPGLRSLYNDCQRDSIDSPVAFQVCPRCDPQCRWSSLISSPYCDVADRSKFCYLVVRHRLMLQGTYSLSRIVRKCFRKTAIRWIQYVCNLRVSASDTVFDTQSCKAQLNNTRVSLTRLHSIRSFLRLS
jgi:hypothetical protein